MLDENGKPIEKYVELDGVLAYTADDIQKPKTLDEVKLLVWVLEHEHRITDVRAVLKHVRKLVNASDMADTAPKLHADYQHFISFMQFLCMNGLELPELMDVLRTHIVYALSREVDVQAYLVSYLFLYGDPEGRLRRGIIQAIRENTEKIGSDLLTEKDKQTPEEPTVNNWMKIYSVAVTKPAFKIENVDVIEFFDNEDNYKKLDEADRETLLKVVKLYNYLRSPSEIKPIIGELRKATIRELTSADERIPSVEEARRTAGAVQPKRRTIEDIKIDVARKEKEATKEESPPKPLPKKQMPPAPQPKPPVQNKPREGIMSYVEQTEFDQAVTKAEEELMKDVGKGKLNVREVLETATTKKEAARVAALLSILGQTRDIEPLVAKDSVYRGKLVNKFGDEVSAHFDSNPSAPVYMRIYLEYVFQDRLKMPEPDAARTAVRIANILGKKYLKMAFMDMATGTFSWAPVEKSGKILRLKYTQ